MKRLFLICALLLLIWPSYGFSETLAQAQTWRWRISVRQTGSPSDEKCTLYLVADSHNNQKQISIKDHGYQCSFFGPIQLIGSDTPEREVTYVYLEAARGGDGDHTGPILQVYMLTPEQGFIKLGEQEIFEASYNRSGEIFTSIKGKVLFSFCEVCDGPEVGDPEYMIYVPVVINISKGRMAIAPSIGKKDREIVLKRFEAQKNKDAKEIRQEDQHRMHVKRIEKLLMELLAR